jgi:hypothetical protein
MLIDCRRCEMYESEHCADCLVTAVLHPPADGVEVDPELDGALDALAGAGLVPVLRFRPRAQDRAGRPDESLEAETG